ncbi:MAG TPA: GAF domain-containing protein [Thermodesulfovibrionales bacterium]|nr:GAF domain-containing protein [Thermodesulfovibrionales bacterium]
MERSHRERLVPICGWCKKIRTEDESWETIEVFFTRAGLGEFTHTMCPHCAEKIFSKRIYLESYQNICKAISMSLSLSEVLNLIVTNVVKVMNVKASSLRLLNKETQQLELAAYHGLSDKYANKGPVVYDGSIVDALAGKPVSIYDITSDANARYRNEALQEGIRSILSIPLRFGDEIIGVLRMYTSEPVEYSSEEMKFVTAIAEQAAIAIVNARVFEKTVSKEKEYLRVFQQVTKAVSSSLQLSEVLALIVRTLPRVMNLKAATIRLLDDAGERLDLVAAHGLSERYLQRGPVDMEANIQEALQEKPVAIYDVSGDSRVFYRKEAEEEGIKSMLTLPVVARSRIIGILRLLSGQQRHFSQQDIDFASALAEQCGTAIENARMYERQYKEAKYLSALQDIAMAISSTLSVQAVMDMIVKRIAIGMNAHAATIRLLDSSRRRLELVTSYGLSGEYLTKGPVDAETSVAEALEGKPVAIYDVSTDARIVYKAEAKKEGICSMLVVPMLFRGEVIGVIRILTKEHRTFTSDEVEFATALAEQAAIAIEYAKAFSPGVD